MAESTVVYTPEANGGTVPAWMAMNNGGLLGGNGLGGGILGFLLGLFFGNGNGFGGFGGGNNSNANSQRELLMTAITSQGEASRAAIASLANSLGQDFGLVNSGVQTIIGSLSTLATQQAVSVPQIINAIQGGNMSLSQQFCQCCCEMKQLVTSQGYENQLATLNQTNTISGAITSGNQRIVDAISDLKATTISEFCAARERDMQADINSKAETITQLRGQIDNAAQTQAFAAMLSPINARLAEIESKQPNTVPVQWPALTAVNTTPYVNGGYYGNNFGFFGNGVSF